MFSLKSSQFGTKFARSKGNYPPGKLNCSGMTRFNIRIESNTTRSKTRIVLTMTRSKIRIVKRPSLQIGHSCSSCREGGYKQCNEGGLEGASRRGRKQSKKGRGESAQHPSPRWSPAGRGTLSG